MTVVRVEFDDGRWVGDIHLTAQSAGMHGGPFNVQVPPEEDASESAWVRYRLDALFASVTDGDPTPAGFLVTAGDGFYAELPWSFAAHCELRVPTAALRVPTQGGEAADSDQPRVRMQVTVPADACLNVKDVQVIRILTREAPIEPRYGTGCRA
ncbi:MAG: hypothetical protein K6T78_09265 [Alicyclobacillus sp.]|nr:hypothetical protein [Alicyclobacillus sp.]